MTAEENSMRQITNEYERNIALIKHDMKEVNTLSSAFRCSRLICFQEQNRGQISLEILKSI
jgi:ABC-type nitrate/sulfonate/bicarbonate transport system ATPase subunit